MAQQHTQPGGTTIKPRSKRTAAMPFALTDADLTQVVGGGDGGPTGAGDRNG